MGRIERVISRSRHADDEDSASTINYRSTFHARERVIMCAATAWVVDWLAGWRTVVVRRQHYVLYCLRNIRAHTLIYRRVCLGLRACSLAPCRPRPDPINYVRQTHKPHTIIPCGTASPSTPVWRRCECVCVCAGLCRVSRGDVLIETVRERERESETVRQRAHVFRVAVCLLVVCRNCRRLSTRL